MGITLTSKTINSTYDSLLKLTDNDSLTSAFKVITDGLGNDTGISINNAGNVNISGTLVVNTKIQTPLIQLTGGTGTQGTMSWNTDEETVDVILNGSTLQLGQEVHVHVRNNSATTAIPNGTPVYVTGTLGASGRLKVAPMIADGTISAEYFIGVTTEEIGADEDGKVTWFGKVRGFDTSGYTEGSKLYVSETVAGGWQTTEPTAPNPVLEVAFTVNSKSNGAIFVRGENGEYLNSLHDVNVVSVADNDLLVYNATDGHWHNSKTIGDISTGNITTSGYLRGPATFVIDPAAYGDDTGLVQILGDLRVDGTTTTVNHLDVTIDTSNLTLASNATTADDANGAGITIAGANATLTYASLTDDFTFNKNVNAGTFIGALTGNVTGNVTGNLTGNASTASKWATARTIIIGDTSKSVDGSANVSWTKAEIGITKANIDALNISSGYQKSFDTRAVASTPETNNATEGIRFDFKQNSTNGLSDGGTYNGVMYWRKYGSTTDWTGGGAKEIAYTDNGNLWHRYGTSTSWGSWRKILDDSNYSSILDARYYTETEIGNFFSGTTAITGYNKSNWDSAYSYSQIGHLPLTGGTLGGNLTVNGELSVTGTIDLSNADLNIGAADIIFDMTSLQANRGLVWDISGTGFVSKFVGGGTNGGMVELYTNMDDAITTGDVFRLKEGSVASTLFSVTGNGAATFSSSVTASSFVKSGGTSSQFLKADGSVDSNSYLTSYTESDTLDSVSDRGASTGNTLTVGGLLVSATAPLLDFVDTNSFTDPNDRFRIRAAGNVGQIRWWDDSAGTDTVLATFEPDGDLGVAGNITSAGNTVLTTGNYGGALDSYYLRSDTSDTMNGALTIVGGGDTLTLQKSNNIPALAFSGAASTKSVIEGGEEFNFYTSGSKRLRITSSGYIDQMNTSTAFRLYDGSTFVGGIGNGNWAYGGTWNGYYSIYANSSKLLFNAGGGSSPTMALDNNGNLGIGTTSPERRLVLDGINGTPALEIKKSSDRIVYLGTGSSAFGDDNTTMLLYHSNVIKINLNTVGDSYFNGGNVGIGTTSPSQKLHVAGSSSVRNTIVNNVIIDGGTSVPNPYDGFGFGITFSGRDYGNATRNYAYISSVMEDQSSSAGGGDAGFKAGLRFYTNRGGSSTANPTEAMRIDSGGRVVIGSDAAVAKLHVVDNAFPQFRINDDTGGGNAGMRLRSYDGSTGLHADMYVQKTGDETGRLGFRVPFYSGDRLTIYDNGLVEVNGANVASKSFRVYYDMDVYNTINFTNASWTKQGHIAGTSNHVYIRNGSGVDWRFDNNSYTYVPAWINLGAGAGIFSSSNGAHFYPNGTSTYATWRIDGSRNGYNGIFIPSTSYPHLMFDGTGNGGIYHQNTIGDWSIYHHIGNNCVGIGGSNTASGYKARVNGNLLADGNVVSYNKLITAEGTYNGEFGSLAASWDGSTAYPTLYSSSTSRYVMIMNPHIPYTSSGSRGYTGSMTGSTLRMEGGISATSYWDLGVGVAGAGEDIFAIGRNATKLVWIDTSGGINTNNWYYLGSSGGMYFSNYSYGIHASGAGGSTYGNITTYGNGQNGWKGYSLHSCNHSFMGAGSDSGWYDADNGRWITYYLEANYGMGLMTSTTSSSYKVYVGGSLYATGDIVAYSDRRVKENIVTIDSALDKVKALRGVYYNRIDDADKTKEIGYIAQEVHEAVPELASYAEDVDEWGVKYSQVTALNTEAIKELAAEKDREIAELKAQIEELKQLILNK